MITLTYHKYTALLIFLFSSLLSFAQIDSPDFVCVKNDSLLWTPSSITCNAHEGYNIYFSVNEQGPYTILTTISDPNTSSFIHSQFGDFYYYIESISNCPGEITLQSDTLTNKFIDKPVLKSASVLNNNSIELSWHSFDHPNRFEYVIYKNTNVGTIEIGRTSDTKYIDTPVDILSSQRYTITVSDKCNQQGLFSKIHSTSTITSQLDSCENTVILELSEYTAWANEGYSIEIISLNHNQTNTDKVVLTTNQQTTIKLNTLDENSDFCVLARYINNITKDTSNTNTVCFHTAHELLDIHYPYNISYDRNNKVNYSWVWNEKVQLQAAEVISNNNDVLYTYDLLDPLQYNNKITLNNIINFPVHLESRDVCSKEISNEMFPPEIEISINRDNVVSINYFEPLLPTESIIDEINLFYINEFGQNINLTSLNNTSGFYETSAGIIDKDSICYYIEYLHTNDTNIINPNKLISKSPTKCINKFPSIYFPNAFSPNGINSAFRPNGKNLSIIDYDIHIYNRYGNEVYNSNNILEGWDGTKENRLMPAGLYLYIATIGRQGIESYTIKGNVYLVK